MVRTPAPLVMALGGALLAALGGCASKAPHARSGQCVPTVEGAAGTGYGDFASARAAFSRSDKEGSFIAVLEDVAWLRFEGDEASVLEKHRAYFEQGYTTFEVTMLTKDFTQPTAEVFELTDSRGARLVGKPVGYRSGMGQESERFAARFQVSFRHAVTRDIGWLRLKRLADGAELEWTFPWAAAPAAAPGAASGTVTPTLTAERPQNLMRPLNPSPPPATLASGRPANLLTTSRSATTGPAVSAIPPTAAVGEPAWSEAPGASTFTLGASSGGAAPPTASAPAPRVVPAAPPAGGLPPPVVRRR